MKTKLFTFFLALLASVGTMQAYESPISVTDGSLADWDNLPENYVFEATCPQNAFYQGLKSVKVYADNYYIYILVEPNMNYIIDREWVPFHVLIDTDNSDATGGFGDWFTDANTDILCESRIFAEGKPYSYNPAVFKWWGEVGASGWDWIDPSVEYDGSDCWGAIVCEKSGVGASQRVDGKFEIQLLRDLLATIHPFNKEEFGIGVEIEQDWSTVGILPQVSPTDDNPSGKAPKMKVKIATRRITTITDEEKGTISGPSEALYGENATLTAVPNRGYCFTQWADGNTDNPRTIELTQDTTMEAFFDYRLTDKCGKDNALTWTLDLATMALEITGKGDLTENYTYGTFIESVIIGDEITSMGEEAFIDCNNITSVIWNAKNCNSYNFGTQVESFTFGDDVEVIPDGLCSGMNKLTSLTIPDRVTSIGNRAFSGCKGLTSVTIPNSVTSMGGFAFAGCTGLTSIEIPNSVASIGNQAFRDCSSLTSIEIPNSITSIGDWAFEDCTSLTSIKIPNSVTSIGTGAFSGCKSLTSIEIPNNITSIEYEAFKGCSSLTSVIIPNSVTSIDDNAFDGCSHLEEIEFGYSLETIGEEAFKGCSRVYQIICPARVTPSVGTDGLTSISDEAELYVPKDCIKKYQVDPNWKRFNIKEISANTTSVDNVVVNPSSNTANISWPVVENAATYELVIKDKNGNTVCTLVFDAEGHLTSIAFNAPSRNDAPQQTQGAGFSFTVTGLEEGTEYNLTLTAKDNNGATIDEKSMAFHTDWPEGIEDVQNDDAQSTKVIRDGKVFILRGDKVYTLQGQEVR